ncbi:MAG TPA: cation transporter [Sphingomicrobium sp.]|nr:cation transporter [Sphingomicrobium sp.]
MEAAHRADAPDGDGAVKVREPYEVPPSKEKDRKRGDLLEWITIPVQLSVVVLLYFILGNSQAMKAAWTDDLLSFIPPIAYLVSRHFTKKEPNERFPYGYYRASTIAYLISAAVIAWVGVSLFYQSALKLVNQEHTPIGTIVLFGHQFWLGWLMEIGLFYSIVTEVIIGKLKQKPAAAIHDKVLFADAQMNAAGWKSESAAALGLIGIYFGFWWADPLAAVIISLDIIKDGWKNLSQVTRDIMDEHPRTLGKGRLDPVEEKLKNAAEKLPWVKVAAARLREEGEVLTGEVFVVPRKDNELIGKIEDATRDLKKLNWRLYDISVMPVRQLEPSEGAEQGDDGKDD